MSYTKLTEANLTRALNGLKKANDPIHVQSVLASVIFSTMHGNTDPLNSCVKKGLLPAMERGFLLTHAIKPFCTKNEDKSYSYKQEKANSTFAALETDKALDWETLTAILPFWKPEKVAEVKKFDAVGSAKRMLAKAEKALEAGEFEGEQAVLAQLIKALKPFNV